MRYKLIQMEKCIRKGCSANREETANDIKHVIEILNRITGQNNYDYLTEAMKPFYEKYPNYENKFDFKPSETHPKCYELINHDTQEQKDLKRQCYAKEEEMLQKDLDELYTFLRQHIRDFWD